MYNVKIKKISDKAHLPKKAHSSDAGFDIFSIEDKTVKPLETVLVKTGIKLELPENTEAQIRPRSGLALKHGITLTNSPGTIDADYRGELGVIMTNLSNKDFNVEVGMKIAQMVIQPVYPAKMTEVDELGDTARGSGGFGSTGL